MSFSAKTKPWFKKLFKRLLKIVVFFFISSLLYTLLCKWIFPPITITQVSNWVATSKFKRDYVSWEEIGYAAKLAAIASEDQLFTEHNGFDWDALKKSFNRPPKKKSKIPPGGGASTISQQTAKNVFLWQGGGFFRKGLEFYFTPLIEGIWGKKRILEVYLNVIEMGEGIFGIEAAAQQYFQKPAKQLTRTQAAMIIACLPNPKKFTVVPLSARVAWRYPQILQQMNYIEDDEELLELLK